MRGSWVWSSEVAEPAPAPFEDAAGRVEEQRWREDLSRQDGRQGVATC